MARQSSSTSTGPPSSLLISLKTNERPYAPTPAWRGSWQKTACAGLQQLFALAPDAWREPPLPDEKDTSSLDFQGPYGVYYWELFLYLPWLLAQRLNQEQQYAEAETWIRYVFDPVHPSDVWRLPALLASTPQGHRASSLSHPLAKSSAVHFRQALYLLYVDILLNRGDAAYRQLTRDSLAEAKLWYIRAKGLLGPRPPLNPVDPWATTTLDKLQNPSTLDSKAVPANTSRLCRSLSPDLLLRWDKIESRLHNLRHHLDLTGKPLSLPLYTATLSPQTLLAAYQQGSAGVSLRPSLRTAQAAHYRFQVLLGARVAGSRQPYPIGDDLVVIVRTQGAGPVPGNPATASLGLGQAGRRATGPRPCSSMRGTKRRCWQGAALSKRG